MQCDVAGLRRVRRSAVRLGGGRACDRHRHPVPPGVCHNSVVDTRAPTPAGAASLQDSARETGRFTYRPGDDSWTWDDDVYRIHGLEPGSVEPTTELVHQSKHPDDRHRVMQLLRRAADDGQPFHIYYRLVGGDGRLRRVVVVGEGEHDDRGRVAQITGFYIDLSPDFDDETAVAVEAAAESRATIEQAKGALMLAYGLDADAAFAMLRWWSRNRRVKIRDLAAGIVQMVGEGNFADGSLRQLLDSLMDQLTGDGPDEGSRSGAGSGGEGGAGSAPRPRFVRDPDGYSD